MLYRCCCHTCPSPHGTLVMLSLPHRISQWWFMKSFHAHLLLTHLKLWRNWILNCQGNVQGHLFDRSANQRQSHSFGLRSLFQFIYLYWRAVIFCMAIPQLIYPFTHWYIFGLFPAINIYIQVSMCGHTTSSTWLVPRNEQDSSVS